VIYRALADLIVLAHLAFVLFVVLGGLLALQYRRAAWVHLPAAAWGAWIELSGGICPLTPLENHLRVLGGRTEYVEGFVERYVFWILYPEGLTYRTQIVLGVAVIAVNLAIYFFVWRRHRARRGSA
jgi:hypothetical protein